MNWKENQINFIDTRSLERQMCNIQLQNRNSYLVRAIFIQCLHSELLQWIITYGLRVCVLRDNIIFFLFLFFPSVPCILFGHTNLGTESKSCWRTREWSGKNKKSWLLRVLQALTCGQALPPCNSAWDFVLALIAIFLGFVELIFLMMRRMLLSKPLWCSSD